MKKVLQIICLLMIVLSFSSCKTKDIPSQLLYGEIVMRNPNINDEKSNKGIAIYDISKRTFSYLLGDTYFGEAVYSEDKSNILTVTDSSEIVEYNKQSSQKSVIRNGQSGRKYSYLKYIPESDMISYTLGPKLFIFDRKLQKETYLMDIGGNYSWSNDGKALIYSQKGECYRLDLSTKKSTKLFPGYGPQYSNNNEYIVYQLDDGQIVLREVKTGREQKYETDKIHYYKFSPDDDSIAVIQNLKNSTRLYGQEMILWNFKNGKSYTLIEYISQGSIGSFDWKK